MSQRGEGGEVPEIRDRIEKLNRAVSIFVRKMEADFSLELNFQPDSIPYMDILLTEVHRSGRSLSPSLYLSVGGYVGETLIRSYEGRWLEGEENLEVELDGDEHTQRLPIFDWVEEAFEDPHGKSLGERLRDVLGDGMPPGDPQDPE